MTVDTTASALAPKTTSDHPVGGGHETGCVMEQLDTNERFKFGSYILKIFRSHAEMVL